MPRLLEDIRNRARARTLSHPWLAWIQQHLSTIAFVSGFVMDNLTLTRVDLLYNHLYFFALIALGGMGIILIQVTDVPRMSDTAFVAWVKRYRAFLPILVQFVFGGLISGFLIFYIRGASLLASWPFLLVLLLLFFGNEFMRSRYEQLLFQINVFFFLLFSYMTFLLPVATRRIGDLIFLASGLVSLGFILLFLLLLRQLATQIIIAHRRMLLLSIGCIYLTFNVFYFLNLIPPLPLSLTNLGIYHHVTRSPEGGYLTAYEKSSWYTPWRDTSGVFHTTTQETAYCFSAVFAPARLSTPIVHVWEYFDETKGRWTQEGRFSYTIEGGREGGYRGYSFRRNPTPGKWKCSIQNERGQTLGAISFTAQKTATKPVLLERLQ